MYNIYHLNLLCYKSSHRLCITATSFVVFKQNIDKKVISALLLASNTSETVNYVINYNRCIKNQV
jgi:hypothetical protein